MCMMHTSKKHGGHGGFSEFIASDDELSVFRRFKVIGARNLLYLQSSMMELEVRLNQLDMQDTRDMNMDILLSTTCWETFSARSSEAPREAERMEVINQIKKATDEYYKALLLYRKVQGLTSPSKRVLRVCREWFRFSQPFVGIGATMMDNEDDLVALVSSSDDDFLSRTLQNLVGRFLPGSRGVGSEQVKYYSSRTVSRLVTVMTVLAASLVIEGAVVCLYVLEDQSVKLGLLAVFTSLFAASLAVMTNGRRTDIILATAACAAILVVFVSQN